MQNKSNHDQGVLAALVERFERQRLPHLLHLKEQMDSGKMLSEEDLDYLTKVIKDSHKIAPLVDRNPQYHKLVIQAIGLYKEIVEQGLENEKSTGQG